MKIRHLKLKIAVIMLLPIFLILKEILYLVPGFVERYYARFLYVPIGRFLSLITGIFPFSIAEFLCITILLLVVFAVVRLVYLLITHSDRLRIAVNWVIKALCVISAVYCLFLLIWGFNYYRQPLAISLHYELKASSVEDLKALSAALIDKTNSLREHLKENNKGVMELEGDFKSIASRTKTGYETASSTYSFLGGSYGKPKGILFSHQLSYTGIAGIYVPFTGEANVNTLVPDPILPATISHEMAHQRGFAREDEANFIAYMVCKAHEDTDFQYSGYLLATIYSMNALHDYDEEAYKELSQTYSDGVARDLQYNNEFWKQYQGPVEELQEQINDRYLKSNKQAAGVQSYGRMVDLLLAEFKAGER